MSRKRSGPPKRREPDPCHGLLPVDKPPQWTSHDVVAKVRNHFRLNKVGHGGTLDPLATGLLVLLIGRGTRLSARVMQGDKTYEGRFRLGLVSDSHDRDGRILEEHDPSGVTREAVEEAFRRYTGEIEQIPPMVSAVKKNGVALYKLARKGKEVEREPRRIFIHSFELLDFEPPFVSFRLVCSKGTYVRTLAHDIGRDLGVGAILHDLRRTASGALSIEEAYSLDFILSHDRETLRNLLIPLDAADTLLPPP